MVIPTVCNYKSRFLFIYFISKVEVKFKPVGGGGGGVRNDGGPRSWLLATAYLGLVLPCHTTIL